MKRFLEYLEEKKLAGYALAGTLGGVALGLAGKPHSDSPKQVEAPVQPIEQPIVSMPQIKPISKETKVSNFHEFLKQKHGKEYDTIMDAATSNGISRDDHENLSLLFAIRKAEHGGPGIEFGVLHPKAKGTDLRTQAGWAAATVMKNRSRHNPKKDGDFIAFLGSRYAPKNVENDPTGLNANWIDNVRAHYKENMSKVEQQ